MESARALIPRNQQSDARIFVCFFRNRFNIAHYQRQKRADNLPETANPLFTSVMQAKNSPVINGKAKIALG